MDKREAMLVEYPYLASKEQFNKAFPGLRHQASVIRKTLRENKLYRKELAIRKGFVQSSVHPFLEICRVVSLSKLIFSANMASKIRRELQRRAFKKQFCMKEVYARSCLSGRTGHKRIFLWNENKKV